MSTHDSKREAVQPAAEYTLCLSLLGKCIFEDSILCFHILQLNLGIVYCLTPKQQQRRQLSAWYCLNALH